ncbi:MAG: S41 family peptidase [Patescibacteria group bacterium]|jgi:carboxyl-terminal processing protease|nr:S41 family peptidase [Patescibacteria group bacterium]
MNLSYNQNNNKKLPFYLVIFVLMIMSFAMGFWWQKQGSEKSVLERYLAYSPEAQLLTQQPGFDFNLYWEVWDQLKRDYVDKNKISDKEMFYGSLKGLAESVNDPYTIFMDPEETREFANDMSGTFEGIGAEVGMRNDIITIIAPLAGMPAEKAGLRAGDRIYAIDGESTLGMNVDEAVKKIRGDKGSEVILTVIRDEEDRPLEISIIRGVIVVKSVKSEILDNDVLLITISNFNDDTLSLFRDTLQTALLNNPKGIILDLRNNPGGYLDTAVAVASAWVPEGPVVVEQFGAGRREEYFALGGAPLQNIKTVILINGGSASASEIVAGALRDYKKATLVGEKTFGKGSVQGLRDLSNGSSLKVTVAQWLTPGGDYINDKGIEPDVAVELTMEDVNAERDPQLDKAIDLILNNK